MPSGSIEGVTVVVQNSDPYTYFGNRPVRVAGGAALDSGTLALAVLKRARPHDAPTLLARGLSGRSTSMLGHRQVEGFQDLERFRVSTLTERTFPLQVDGDFVGEFESADFEVAPRSLSVVA